MDADERRELLEAVARGEIDPEAAADRLAEDATGDEPDGPAGGRAADSGIDAIRVTAAGANVRVIGDESVATADVRGDHEFSVEDNVMVVRVRPARQDDAWAWLSTGGRRGHRRGRIQSRSANAVVRVNPTLALHLDADASNVGVRSVRGPLTVRAMAGSVRLRDVSSTLDASIRAGVMRVAGRFTEGSSSIRCEMGRVRVDLDPASDVRVRSAVELGHLDLRTPGGTRPDPVGEWTLGSGRASLTIDGRMSSIDIRIAATEAAAR